MNCPSRTDEPPLTDHPTWNQNPPFLSGDLTTCQDLNGIANAREHRDGSGGAAVADDDRGEKGMRRDGWAVADRLPVDAEGRKGLAWGWGTFSVSHSQVNGVTGGEGHSLSIAAGGGGLGAVAATTAAPPAPCSVFGWLSWTASVLVCAAIMSASRLPESVLGGLFGITEPGFISPNTSTTIITDTRVTDSIPLRKRSTCATGGFLSEEEYNTPLHVGALLIILTVSFAACAFPIVASRIPRLRLPARFFFAVRHFGTGVLLATAFVHLLPTAFTLLGNPCLSSFWVEDYPAMPGAIALAAVFFVSVIEMVLQPARHLTEAAGSSSTGGGCMSAAAVLHQQERLRRPVEPAQDTSSDDVNAAVAERPMSMEMRPAAGNTNSLGRQLSNIGQASDQNTTDVTPTPDGQAGNRIGDKSVVVDEENRFPAGADGHLQLTPQQQHQKDVLQCMMLEVGILFHSVFIGMTLSVSIGHEFVILLIAIAFHQTFEGLALGSRIANIKWDKGSWQPWMMSLAYGCTTPLGQAIGIATHRLYNPESEFGLVLVGTMNAISSGLLVFASLVELLSEDFLSDESWRILRGRRRVGACFLVLFGAIGMSLVGAWA
ncbi:hypothetical protein MCOR25_000214 [Pyricularia grisea]|uniref:Uncharacterized protein n=1 Tax=Pyricularia grisea TaxID=148305 RepID=A0A6P8BJZ7_PYRGI|nr:uncharacterized protein PgNI_02298 [Pyricularia grisea]KAI6383294.1 hypothetical protein MCOR25_000214 [Pyricularia grisea]TLD17014.1 hypothetical protein PgNI_02298 [Pyricularia grisea]